MGTRHRHRRPTPSWVLCRWAWKGLHGRKRRWASSDPCSTLNLLHIYVVPGTSLDISSVKSPSSMIRSRSARDERLGNFKFKSNLPSDAHRRYLPTYLPTSIIDTYLLTRYQSSVHPPRPRHPWKRISNNTVKKAKTLVHIYFHLDSIYFDTLITPGITVMP